MLKCIFYRVYSSWALKSQNSDNEATLSVLQRYNTDFVIDARKIRLVFEHATLYNGIEYLCAGMCAQVRSCSLASYWQHIFTLPQHT